MASDGDSGDAHRPEPLIELTLREGPGPERAAGAAVAAVALEAGVESERVSGLQALVEELVRESLDREHAGRPQARLTVRADGRTAGGGALRRGAAGLRAGDPPAALAPPRGGRARR